MLIAAALTLLIALSVALALYSEAEQAPLASAPEAEDVPSANSEAEAKRLASADPAPLAIANKEQPLDAGPLQAATVVTDAGPRAAAVPGRPTRPVHSPADAGGPSSRQPAGARAAPGAPQLARAASASRPGPDISHRSSSTPNPSAFDINGYLPTAYKKARDVFADAELVRIDADGVLPNGRANLSLDTDFSVLYRFQSRANASRPKELVLGAEHKPTCLYYVSVSAAEVTAYGLEGWQCKMEYAGKPKCSAKEIWAQAIAKGAPASNAIAGLWYASHQGRGRWSFSIKDTNFSWWIPDAC